jgi:hypothetical protein
MSASTKHVEHRDGAIDLTFPVLLLFETSSQLSQIFCANFGSYRANMARRSLEQIKMALIQDESFPEP